MSEENKTAEPGKEKHFVLQRIYMKDLSFEAPLGAKAFAKQWQPQVNVDLNTTAERIEGDNFEAVLRITITAKLGEETVFLIEVHQAGIFFVSGIEGEELRRVLMIGCPNVLFPYARESIDSLASRGGFPPLALQQVNFEAVYFQSQQQQTAQH